MTLETADDAQGRRGDHLVCRRGRDVSSRELVCDGRQDGDIYAQARAV